MSKYAGRNARLYVGGYDISSLASGFTPVQEREMHPYAICDGVQGYHQLPGLAKDALSIDGLFDDNYHATLVTLFGSNTGQQVIIPFGTAQGARGLACNAVKMQNLKWQAVTTDINKLIAELLADTLPWDEVRMIQEAATKTTSSNSTGVNFGSNASVTLTAYLQIWELGADDTLEVKVQESSDNGVADAWADSITFTTLNGAVATRTTERKTAVAAGDRRYMRVLWTFGGAATYTAKFCVALDWKLA